MSGASKRANGRASAPVLQSVFLAVIDRSASCPFPSTPAFHPHPPSSTPFLHPHSPSQPPFPSFPPLNTHAPPQHSSPMKNIAIQPLCLLHLFFPPLLSHLLPLNPLLPLFFVFNPLSPHLHLPPFPPSLLSAPIFHPDIRLR